MKAYIIHVKSAVEREKHLAKQLKGKNLDIKYILEGDKEDLHDDILEKYFSGGMKTLVNANVTSCALKHIFAYQQMIEDQEKYALIFEDDVILYAHFNATLSHILNEIETKHLENIFISLEDSNLKYVKGSERKKGTYLYPQRKGRMAAAYLIDLKSAKNLVKYVTEHPCVLPIDWLHNECFAKGIVQLYWSEPTIATQGSLTGELRSLLGKKEVGLYKIAKFSLSRKYKKLLYRLR